MYTKSYRYFGIVLLAFLAACGKQTDALLTETSVPTTISPTLVSTSTFIPATDIPTPLTTALPTEITIPIITPDAMQVERWKEYQTALVKSIFPNDSPELFLCEWDILGRSDQEVYVWAVCGIGERTGSVPAVIHLNPDGSILSAEIPWDWSVENIHNLFPEDVRNKFDYMYAGEIQEISEHLAWREAHPGEPPLIILSATPAVTPTP
jgi:hypothetical protein